jgi:hypothetical protein
VKLAATLGSMCLIASVQATAQLAASQLSWPTPSLPSDVSLAGVGDELTINGVPARIFTFTTRHSVDEVIEQFQAGIDSDFTRAKPLARQQQRIDVGGKRGDFWLALQLEQRGRETRGTWSATPRFIPDARQPVVRPAGFPHNARVLQQIDSFDAGKRSQMAVGIDPSPVDGVAQRLEDEMRGLGFNKQALPAINWPSPDRYVAVFSKGREEVWVTLQQQRTGTAVTVNRLSALEVLQ